MSQEKTPASSPFAALSYQEQQDRWLEWRSRQLDYQAVAQADVPETGEKNDPPAAPALKMPFLRQAAPSRHRELDQVLARHAQAARRAGAFQSTSARSESPQ